MLFIVLENIIRSIRKHIPCQQCKKHYRLQDFYISDIYEGEMLIELTCKHCNNSMTLSAVITETNQGISMVKEDTFGTKPFQNKNTQTHTVKENPISEDEISKVNNTLKAFNGGFSDLFKSQNKTS